MEELINTIQSVISLSPEDGEQIRRLFSRRSLRKNEHFLEEGEVCRRVGFVTRGLLRYYINVDGEDKNYTFAQEGEFVCNYESFIPQSPSSKSIQALEDCDLLQISFVDLQAFYDTVTRAERFGRVVIEQVFIQTLQDLGSFYTDTPEERYEKFIARHPDLQQRIPQYHIASYVGVKPQSLSRIRKRMADQG